jgi:two-component system LytT family sensor kinase
MVGFTLLERSIYYFILFPEMFPRGLEYPFFFLPELWHIGVMMYSFVFLFSGLRVFKSFIQQQRRQSELEKQNLRSELAILRAQISPHFLFNTLNNIDVLVYRDQDKASDSIVRLSEIMRYMLYEANTEQVPLEREITYLSSMIDLLRLRLEDASFIHFEVFGEVEHKQIPPMLLVPFVENAFKHGKKYGSNPGIVIRLTVDDRYYVFDVRNHLDPHRFSKKDEFGGIGLQNLRRRLDLLFPNQYRLDLETSADQFSARLKIPAILKRPSKKAYETLAYT